MARFIQIVEVGPRDGLQNEKAVLDPAVRADLVRRLEEAGAKRIEAVSFVHPKYVPQMAGAEDVMAVLPREVGRSRIGLVLNGKGYGPGAGDRGGRGQCLGRRDGRFRPEESGSGGEGPTGHAGRHRGPAAQCRGVRGRAVAVGHDLLRLGLSVRRRGLGRSGRGHGRGHRGDGGPGDRSGRHHRRGRPLGGDAEGRGGPGGGGPDATLRLHFHDTRNTGLANAYAGVQAGIDVLDASVGGIGGCPFAPGATGNIATEDLVYMLERGGFETGYDLNTLIETTRWIGQAIGRPAPSALSRAGGFPRS